MIQYCSHEVKFSSQGKYKVTKKGGSDEKAEEQGGYKKLKPQRQ